MSCVCVIVLILCFRKLLKSPLKTLTLLEECFYMKQTNMLYPCSKELVFKRPTLLHAQKHLCHTYFNLHRQTTPFQSFFTGSEAWVLEESVWNILLTAMPLRSFWNPVNCMLLDSRQDCFFFFFFCFFKKWK